jgi:Protein of unknown function (DUF2795)
VRIRPGPTMLCGRTARDERIRAPWANWRSARERGARPGIVPVMDTASVARLQAALEGVDLPASVRQLARYAAEQGAEAQALEALRRLPGGMRVRSLDEVAEALVPVQPVRPPGGPGWPGPESGAPPGGEAYLDPDAEPGAVRDDVGDGPAS